jgi:radical SAM superfamily enzyme YgiQ (UPF0313 family)
MSKGLLVTYGGYPYTPSSLFPDNGMANLAAVLRAAGHDVRVWDLNTVSTLARMLPPAMRPKMRELRRRLPDVGRDADVTAWAKALDAEVEAGFAAAGARIGDEIVREVAVGAYDWVGFKLYMGDGFRTSAGIAARIKARCPRVKVFAGGPQVDLVRGALLERVAAFDAVAVAEGEAVIVALAEWAAGRRSPRDIANVYWRDGNDIRHNATARIEVMDELPTPLYDEDVYPAMARDDEKIHVLTYDESRGCPYQCAFCIHATKSGVVRRAKTPERVADELAYLRLRYDTRLFRFAGSATPYSLLTGLSRLLIARGVDLHYSVYATPHGLDPRDLPLLVEGGLWGIFFGVESASPRVLREGLGKRKNRVPQVEAALRACLDAGLFTVGSVIYPAPGEDEESTEETVAFLTRVFGGRRNGSVPVAFAGLFPQTPWFADREKYGFEIGDERAYLNEIMDYRIKSLMPFALWPEASYRLDGRPQRELARQTAAFLARLRSNGVVTMLLDDTALIATLAGIPIEDALERLVGLFLTGDEDAIRDLVRTVNAKARVGAGPLPRGLSEARAV